MKDPFHKTEPPAPHDSTKVDQQNVPTRKTDDPDGLDAKLRNTIEAEFGPLLVTVGNHQSLNQVAFAALFSRKHLVSYKASDDLFLRCSDDNTWKGVGRGELKKLLASMLKEALADKVNIPELLAKRTVGLLDNLLKLIEIVNPFGVPAAPKGAFLAVGNGFLNLTTDQPAIRPIMPGDWVTEKLPWAYDPDAKCERFLNELLRPALPSEDDIHLIQRDFGRQLFEGNRAQTVSVLWGLAESGKSVFVLIMEAMIGAGKVAQLRSDQLSGRFEIDGFRGKTTLLGKDVPSDYLDNRGAAVIKSLTGADRIQTEQKFGGKHNIRGTFYVVITTNSRLIIRLSGDVSAWRRRLVVYEFSRQAPEVRIPDFDEVLLKEEGSGILNFLIAGFLAHRQELREHGKMKLTAEQQQRVDDWLMESDALRAFATSSIRAGVGTISVEEVWTAFRSFARKRQWRLPRTQRFHEDFPEVMFELFGVERDNHIRRQGSEVRGYKGVQFIGEEVEA